MNKLVALTKVLFKTNLFAGNDNSKSKKHNKILSFILIAFLIAFVLGFLGVPIILALDSILSIVSLENIIISMILPLAGITTIVFSVFSVVSVFYLSKDSDHLLHMPISAKDIMMGKFLVSLVNEYYILFMFILPCLIGVGVGIDAGAMYYVYAFLVFLLLPIIPSVIVALIILIITRFTGVVKNKDMFMYISMFLILTFSLGYTFVIQEFITVNPDNIGVAFGDLENEVLPYFRAVFPFYNSAADALVNFDNLNGVFSLIAFIIFNFLALLLIYVLGDKLYLKALTTNNGSKKKFDKEEAIRVKKESTFSALLKKEWLVIKRTPIFMLNIVIIIFIMPIVFLISFFVSYTSGDQAVMLPSSSDVLQILNNPIAYLIVVTVGVFFTSFSLAASTAISREGSNAWFMKVIPISAFKQINVKVFFASVLDLLGVFIIAIIPIVYYKIPLYYCVCVLIPLVIIVALINYFNIYLDLKKPKIKWNEESVAVKQNMNSLVSILLTMAISVVFGLIAYLFYKYKFEVNVVVLSGIVSAVCGIILAFIVYLFKKNDNKLLDNVD